MVAQKFIIILFAAHLFFACKEKQELIVADLSFEQIEYDSGPPPPSTKEHLLSRGKFDWLIGDWIRTNEKKGKQTFESWNKKNDSEYIGFSFTLQNNDTIWKENVRFIKLPTGWNFEVTGKGETKPTIFTVTEIKKAGFTCENKKNEFPKQIQYFKNGNNLKAVISGNGTEIPFEFERIMRKD